MSNRRLPSPYFRYLKARLWNLARPSFWGTAIFLSVIGLTIREFWMRPDMLTSRQSKPVATQPEANSTLSAEDRAIMADIDNLPILKHDSEQAEESALETAEPISQPKKGNQNPLQEAIKNQNTANTIKSNSNSTVAGAPASSFKYDNPFLTQAQNLLQFGNALRNDSSRSNELANSFNQANQTNQPASGLIQGYRSANSTQRLIAVNSLEAALNPSSLNPSLTQAPLIQVANRYQPITQESNNNFNTLPQGINNSVSPTQFAQPNITTQTPTNYYNNLNGTNPTQTPTTYYGNLNGANPTQTPTTYYNNLNGANPTQTPTTYYGNLNGANPAQTPTTYYNNLNGTNPTQQRIYSNIANFGSNNFNNSQPLPTNTSIPQTSNTVTYPSATNLTPANAATNGTLTTPTVQQYPSQVPNSGLPVRY